MAYLHKQNDDEQQGQPMGQSSGLLSGYGQAPQGDWSGITANSIPYSGGPSATGHVNFDRIYNANAGTAANMANQISNQVQGDVSGAKAGLAKMQGKFGQAVSTGEGTGPSGYDTLKATGQLGQSISAAQPANLGHGQVTAPAGQTAATTQTPETDAQWLSRMQAGAAGKYSGPQNLQQMAGYGGLLDQYTKAGKELGSSGIGSNAGLQGMFQQRDAGPYIEGGDKLNAALTGQAGRPAFSRLQQQNQNFGSQLGDAVTASSGVANRGQQKANQNASAYQNLLGDYAASQAPIEDGWVPTAAAKGSSPITTSVDRGKAPVGVSGSGGYITGNDRPWWEQIGG